MAVPLRHKFIGFVRLSGKCRSRWFVADLGGRGREKGLSVNYELGFKRLAISLVIALVLLFVLYATADNLIDRRYHLLTIEIIVYLVFANIVSILLFFGGYRLARWVYLGFNDDRSDTERGNTN